MNDELHSHLIEIHSQSQTVTNMSELRAYSGQLCSLGSLILTQWLGENFKAIYPFCGLDVLSPYLLGGNWVLLDKSWSDYQTEIPKYHIPRFEEARESKRIQILERSIEEAKEEVMKFNPQAVLIKYAGSEENYNQIFDFLTSIVQDQPMLIIACVSRQLESTFKHSLTHGMNVVKIQSTEEIAIKRAIQPDYQTFFFLDRLKFYSFFKLGRKVGSR
jgi:hypothetical protein